MNNFSRLFCLMSALWCLTACTVSNNLYIANPNPMGKGNNMAYIGVGTGVQLKIDSVNKDNGNINFSNKIATAPILAIGGQFGISKKTDIRLAVHFPKIIGGFGIRAGLQHSFWESNSKINIALGVDLGGVFSRDSIKILGSKTSVNKETNGALNADFFIPFSVKLNTNTSLIITPRYSFNTFYIRRNQLYNEANNFNLSYPALSLGIKSKKMYFEITTISYDNKLYPHFGFARLLDF